MYKTIGFVPLPKRALMALFFVSLLPQAYARELSFSSSNSDSNFVEAKRVQSPYVVYPKELQKKSHAGVVDTIYSVNTQGEVFDVVIKLASDPLFEEAAIKTIKRYKLEPALLNGEPVESTKEMRIMFRMANDEAKVSRQFFRSHSRAMRLLKSEKPNQKKLRSIILRMRETPYLTQYALKYLYHLETQYEILFGDAHSQSEALRKLELFIGSGNKKQALENQALERSTRQSVFQSLVNAMRLPESLLAFERYARKVADIPPAMTELHEKVISILRSGQVFRTPLNFSNRTYDLIKLAQRGFALEVEEGDVLGITLRCQARHTELEYRVDTEYKIPSSWGSCWLQVDATPNATASVLFFAPEQPK